MNPPPDTSFFQQLFFQQNFLAGQYEQWMDHLGSVLRYGGSSLVLSVLGCALFSVAALIVYRPKLTRGALWLPAFGLFGGKPTLYMRTRPASVCGIFTSPRRLQAKTVWRRRARQTAKRNGHPD